MSVIGGIVTFNGAPVSSEILAALAEGLEEHGPDGGNNVLQESVGMVHRAFHTNSESRLEHQPLVRTDGCILSWDGRLDNREELIRLLRDGLANDFTDCSIVMTAYNKWGLSFPSRIIGDFAFSLWNPSSRTLLLGRDPVGARLLFYHVTDERIVWSSQLNPLLRLPEMNLEVDDEYIAGYLRGRPKQGRTPYKNIHAATPGSLVIIRRGTISAQRFWGLDPGKEIRYRTDKEYEDHFLHLFSEAVRARLRVDGQVWCDLSGGLDSSAIVCMADHIMKTEPAGARKLETVSAVFDESPTSDERRFISLVEEKRGQAGHHFRESEYPLLATSAVEGLRSGPNPIELWSAYHKGVRKEMRERGIRVLLCGIGGDELLTSSLDPSPELADLLVQCKFRHLHQRLQVWSLALKKPYLELFLNHTLIPSLPRTLRSVHKRRERAKPLALLQPRFIKQFDLYDGLLGPKDIFGFRLPSSRGQAVAFLSVRDIIAAGYLLAWGPLEMSYPFTHRPLVEFLQAIPPTQWIRPGESRSLLRRALRSHLPREIAARKGKGSPAEATLRAVAREWPTLQRLLKNALVCSAGYVDPQALKALMDQPNPRCDLNSLSVIRIAYLELWLRDLERHFRTMKCASQVRSYTSLASRTQERVAGSLSLVGISRYRSC